MKKDRHPPDASLLPQSKGQVQYNSAQPGVPGTFARTGPVAQQTNRCSVDSFARPSAASMRDDLAPATSQPRISYASREFLSKKGDSPKKDNPSSDDLDDQIWMAMSESLQHADAEYFLSLMNGTKGTGLSRRPSVEVDGAPLHAQSRQYHTQGTRAVDTALAAHDTGHQAVTFQPAGIDANLKTERQNFS
jgi:hypothetical protein